MTDLGKEMRHRMETENKKQAENIWCSSNSIVNFDEAIESADDVREWVQDRGYSCDETTDIPLEKVFAGVNLSGGNGLHYTIRLLLNYILNFTIRAFYEDCTEKNMLLTRGQAKQMRKN